MAAMAVMVTEDTAIDMVITVVAMATVDMVVGVIRAVMEVIQTKADTMTATTTAMAKVTVEVALEDMAEVDPVAGGVAATEEEKAMVVTMVAMKRVTTTA